MDFVLSATGAAAGFGFGWFAAAYQHLLYREPAFREEHMAGRRLLVVRLLLASACGLSAGLALRPGHYDLGPALLTVGFSHSLLVLASTDFERKRLPNNLMYPTVGLALVFAWAWPDRDVEHILVGGGIAAGIAVALFAFGGLTGALLGVRATAFGLGDVKLIVLLGLLCGWPAFFPALLYGVLAAGAVSVVLLLRGQSKSVFSYGPYLILGGLVVLLWPSPFV
ncbi:MAG: A24 family peptidase [Anaerolineaceae bacterium]